MAGALESLRQLAIGPAPTDGFGPQPAVAPALISIEALLRGRGRNDDADAWVKRVMAADDAVQALTARAREDGRVVDQGFQPGPQAPLPAPAAASSGSEAVPLPPVATMTKAVQTLDAVKAYMQETVAPALQIALGFSDADGD